MYYLKLNAELVSFTYLGYPTYCQELLEVFDMDMVLLTQNFDLGLRDFHGLGSYLHGHLSDVDEMDLVNPN